WGGVQVRFNGFRVYPYGDPKDDWLGIERDRARRAGRPGAATDEQDDDTNESGGELFTFAKDLGKIDPGRVLLSLLSSKSFLGCVEVNSEVPMLKPKADRLGFVENDAFSQLVAFTRFAIDWATIWRDFYIQTEKEKSTEEAREELSTVLGKDVSTEQVASKAVEFLEAKFNQLVTLIPDTREQRETRRIVHQTTKALQTSVANDKHKLRRLRLIASASTLTLLFSHEIKSLLGTLDSATRTLRKVASEVTPEEKPRVIELAVDIEHAKDRFKDLVELTALVGAVGQQAEATDLNLHQHLARAVRCFDLIVRDYRLNIDTRGVPKNVMVGPFVPGELYAVLLNVLSNAIKSVIAEGKEKSIVFTAHTEGKHAILTVSDTGLGLAEEQYEAVFASFVSDPEGRLYERLEKNLNPQDLLIFGQGSGLGLSIVRDILESRGGRARFVAPGKGWNATLELTLP
ncbi:MAG: HAMP domain-containing histidine kinase, partial [Planctomycetaceae bacterium]|nr:HAMP domain-containing histidine kinase [Planctomycetaceae bacterium]